MSEYDDTTTDLPADDGGVATDTPTDTGEPWSFDADGDGVTDTVQWNFGDGTWQEIRDTDADGQADVLMIDVNGDDSADIVISENPDGTYTVAQDADGDGEFEEQQTFTRDEIEAALPGVADLLDQTFGSSGEPSPDAPGGQGDGSDEPVAYDTDENGQVDAVVWNFGDGTWQVLVDESGDGQADALYIDANGDDNADVQIFDNEDGSYTILQDSDGDGVFETEGTLTRAELDEALPGVGDLLDTQLGEASTDTSTPDDTTTPTPDDTTTDDGGVISDYDGDGVADTVHWDFGDGTWQELLDLDGDQNADALIIDTNGDETADYAIAENGDGTYTIYVDSDGDGVWDDEGQVFTRAELDESLPGVSDLLDSKIGGGSEPTPEPEPEPQPEPVDTTTTEDGGVISDYDGDGVADTVHWDFGDGTWQELLDLDGDQNADVLIIDTNGDETADYAIAENGDGTYTIYVDSDGDGVWDDEGQVFTRAELDESLPGVSDLLDSKIGGGSGPTPEPEPEPQPEPVDNTTTEDGGVISDYDGDGVVDTVRWDFGDGTWQELWDVDGDQDADVLVIDTNGDDAADYAITDNGDGSYTIYADSDGDGQWDDEGTTLTRAELDESLPGVADLLDSKINDGNGPTPEPEPQPEPQPEPVDEGGVVSDYDGDGVVDTVRWDFGDGTWQELWDVDGDQDADVLVIDTNGDDAADYAITDNGDGSYTIYADSDGDGQWDDEGTTLTRAELDESLPGVSDLLDSKINDGNGPTPEPEPQPEPQPEPVDEGGVVSDYDGDGVVDTVRWDFGDGTWQELWDVDGDQDADILVIDTNGDAAADYAITDNGDGSYTIFADSDGDGEWDDEGTTLTRAELDESLPGVADLLDSKINDGNGPTPEPEPQPEPQPQPVDNTTTEDGGVVSDFDGDGLADTVRWDFGDGTWQELWDVDGDQDADILVIDTNGDDAADYAITDNGDGTYTIYADSDGDGEWDDEGTTLTRAELDESLPGVADLLDAKIGGSGHGPDGGDAVPFPEPAGDTQATGDVSVLVADAQISTSDVDDDGQVDVVQLFTADGVLQEIIDVDGDLNPDVMTLDVNDGAPDVRITDNEDGTYTIEADSDGDTVMDTTEVVTADELEAALPGATTLLDTSLDDPALEATELPTQPPPAADPASDTDTVPMDPDVEWQATDTDGDGRIDTETWSFPDGTWQELQDIDGDTRPDVLIIDTDADDQANILVGPNGDGTYTVYLDMDGDGTFEVTDTMDRADLDARLPGAAELLDAKYVDLAPDGPPVETEVDDAQVDGSPTEASQYWFNQAENGNCVPASVAMLVSQYTGEALLSEDQILDLAHDMGLLIYDSEGVYGISDAGALALLEAAGIPAELVQGDMGTLEEALEDGKGVMLFVDSGEIWYGEDTEDDASDHAVLVTGIDEEAGVVYLSDPGNPNGNMLMVPIAVFEDAWADSGYSMVVCEEPAPGFGDDAESAPGEGDTGEESASLSEAASNKYHAAAAALTTGPWALLPVVLPAESVAVAVAG